MRKLLDAGNVDNSNPADYPDGRIKDNTGAGNGTPVNEFTKGDIHQTFLKAKRLYGITENGLPDNETNGFQMLDGIIALASKNDFILTISDNAGVLSVPVKLGYMKIGEQIVCKAGLDKSTQTIIQGTDGANFTIAYVGIFKANEYVRLVKTASNTITLIRLVDAVNADLAVGEYGYLKKASQSESDAGIIDTKSITPLVEKVTFTKRVNGTDSEAYLATQVANGLMSLEDKTKLDNFESNVKNIGFISGVNPGSSGSYTVGGDVVSAVVFNSGSGHTAITVTVANTLTDVNYFVRMSVQSLSVDINTDTSTETPVFQPISATVFRISLRESAGTTQNLKIHIETVKL